MLGGIGRAGERPDFQVDGRAWPVPGLLTQFARFGGAGMAAGLATWPVLLRCSGCGRRSPCGWLGTTRPATRCRWSNKPSFTVTDSRRSKLGTLERLRAVKPAA
jgi:hypothetical protein